MGYYFFAVLVLIGPFVVEPSRAMLVLFGALAAAMTLAFKHARRERSCEANSREPREAGECACVRAGEGLLDARVHGRESQPSLLDQAPRAASQEDWDPPFDDLMRR